MKHILVINTIGMGYEGISSVILNYLEHMDKENLDLHIAVSPDTDCEILARIEKIGKFEKIAERNTNLKEYIIQLTRLLKKEKFDAVHIHGNSGTMFLETLIAKVYGVNNIIVHCHNTVCSHPIINFIFKYPMCILADKRIACSSASGKWLYHQFPFIVLNNAIDLEKYRYNEELREYHRARMNLRNSYVIGHSGSFIEQKNHEFLIAVFYEYHKMNQNAKLLLMSDGPLMEEIKKKIEMLGLRDSVIFAGRRSDAAEYYNAMDLFLLPSRWEGLPLVMIEAQANALPVIVSDVITDEAMCTPRTFKLDLKLGEKIWAEKIKYIESMNFNRNDNVESFMQNKAFDIKQEASTLRNIYL